MMTSPRAFQQPRLGPPSQSASVNVPSRLADRHKPPAPIRFPPDNFKHSLTLFSKSFSSFPRGTCSLSVSHQYLALDGIYHPIGAAFPNNPIRGQCLVVRAQRGSHPLRCPFPWHTLPRSQFSTNHETELTGGQHIHPARNTYSIGNWQGDSICDTQADVPST
ncbi:hypothetical protein MtrunA17_Chr5g0422031 [Medicago truncatula]|uniref:Protein TAR1 n=1 Tax=Medicago truncatula TaxID=3880 RepID=A0A396HWL4_MEDTR|nr:hypothetical protein MtrunA17_Chr5g0422031 [Medicago truncatula]